MSQNDSLHMQTPRLNLRPFAPDDLPLAARIMRNPRIVFWRKTRVSLNEIRAGLSRSKKMNAWGLGWWLVFEAQTNRLVGSVMLQPLENTFEIEIGYHLLPEYWGRGYGFEAAREIVRFAFETLGLPVIRAVVLPRNRPSLRIINRLGFTPSGTLFHADLLHRYFKLVRQDYMDKKHNQTLLKNHSS